MYQPLRSAPFLLMLRLRPLLLSLLALLVVLLLFSVEMQPLSAVDLEAQILSNRHEEGLLPIASLVYEVFVGCCLDS
jgi:hypothetical protein